MRLYFDFANGGKRAQIFVGQIRKRKKRAAFGWFSANTLSQKKTGFIIFAIFVILLALPPAPRPPPLPPPRKKCRKSIAFTF